MSFVTKCYLEKHPKTESKIELKEIDKEIKGVNQVSNSICMFASMTFVYHMLIGKFDIDNLEQSAKDVINEATDRFRQFKYLEKDENKDKLDELKRDFQNEKKWYFQRYKGEYDKENYSGDNGTLIEKKQTIGLNLYFPELSFTYSDLNHVYNMQKLLDMPGLGKAEEYIMSNDFTAGIMNRYANYFGVVKIKNYFILFDSHNQKGNGAPFKCYRSSKVVTDYIEKLFPEPDFEVDPMEYYNFEITPLIITPS